MRIVVLRCTAKLLNLLGARANDLAVLEPNDADWYVNLLWLDRRKCLLLAHAGTLFPVFAADVRKAELLPLGSFVARLIQWELRAEGLPLDAFGNLDLNSIELARTASRTVLGYMNEMARYCEYAIADSGGLGRCDIERLNGELRRQIHLSRQPPGHFVPIDLIRARTEVQIAQKSSD
jgi:hypothetical protein